MRKQDIATLNNLSLAEFESILNAHTRDRIEVDRWTQFTWSVSRHKLFEHCRRKYYLNYYGSRRVREAKHEAISAVWWLKQVTSLAAWIGTVVHESIRELLLAYSEGQMIFEDQYTQTAIDMYYDGITASNRGSKHKTGWVILDGHAYSERAFEEQLEVGAERVTALMTTLLNSEAYQFIMQQPAAHLKEIDEPFQSFEYERVPVGTSPLDVVRVFAIPDVLLHDGEHITIIDWKTGDVEDSGIHNQAGVYRLYAHQRYGLAQEAISVKIAAVGEDGALVDPPGGTPSIEVTEDFVRSSMQEMIEQMDNIKYNTVALADYPMTDDLDKCSHCGFRRACWRHNV